MEPQQKPTLNIYIDSNNFYKNAVQLLGVSKAKFNWGALILGIRDVIQKEYECSFSKAIYYSALSAKEDNEQKYNAQKRFLDAINRIPYVDTHIGRLAKVPKTSGISVNPKDPSTYKHVEKNTDINISNDMLQHMYTNSTDIFVLCSADGDFEDTIKKIKDSGKTVLAVTPVGSKSIAIRNAIGDENIFYLDEAFLRHYINS